MTRRAELMRGRPRDIHPHAWLRVLAKRQVSGQRGGSGDAVDQSWLRRVSAAYERLLAEAGVEVER